MREHVLVGRGAGSDWGIVQRGKELVHASGRGAAGVTTPSRQHAFVDSPGAFRTADTVLGQAVLMGNGPALGVESTGLVSSRVKATP
jgi:hypothetical protein